MINQFNKKVLFIFLTILLISGCNALAQKDNVISYSKISRINVEIVKKIGEDGDHLLGRLEDLVHMKDGTILVSDLGKTTVEQFSNGGDEINTIAKQGKGPGELSSFFRLFRGSNETLIIRQRGGSQRIDYFKKGKDNLYKYINSWAPQQFKNRFVTFIGVRSSTEYYASAPWDSQNIQQLITNQSNYILTPIVIVDKFENILEDSLHLLKKPMPMIELSGNSGINVLGMPPYQSRDRFRIMEEGRYLIARPDSSALYFYTNDNKLDKKIHLNIKERPVEEADLDYHFKLINADGEVRRIMEERVPKIKPIFLNIWVSQQHIWLHTDTSEDGKEIVVLTLEGKPVGKFTLPPVDEIEYCREEGIYVLHKDPKTGHSIRIYDVEL
jgi:hypothetical protein